MAVPLITIEMGEIKFNFRLTEFDILWDSQEEMSNKTLDGCTRLQLRRDHIYLFESHYQHIDRH